MIISLNNNCICDFSIGNSSVLNFVSQKELKSKKIFKNSPKYISKNHIEITKKKSFKKMYHHKSQTLSSRVFQEESITTPELKFLKTKNKHNELLNPLLTLRSLRIERRLGDVKSNVMLVKDNTNQLYAMKVLTNSSQETLLEYLQMLKNLHAYPFIAKINNVFIKENKLYLITEYLPKGELFKNAFHRVPESALKSVASEILLGICYLRKHLENFARVLSPDNILIDNENHVKLANYGFCSFFNPFSLYTPVSPFCRTGSCSRFSENLDEEIRGNNKEMGDKVLSNFEKFERIHHSPPEIFKGGDVDEKSDIWVLANIVYELATGRPLMRISNFVEFQEYLNENKEIQIPMSKISKELVEFLKVCLKKSREERANIEELKTLPFFKEINWEKIMEKKEKGWNFTGSAKKKGHHRSEVLIN